MVLHASTTRPIFLLIDCSDDRFDKQSSTPYFLCKRTMSATTFDPLTTVNSFERQTKEI